MSEKALLFGQGKSLVGVLTDPDPGVGKAGCPAVVVLNAGVLHHVGPNRLHVQLARALASSGLTTLRFDLAGIGDSRPREGAASYMTAALADIREALDLLEATRGLRQFILVGICSGADNGLQAASADARVVGVALIDGYNVPSIRHVLYAYAHRLVSLRSWSRLALGRSEFWEEVRRVLSTPRGERASSPASGVRLPSHVEHLRQLRAVVDRGVKLLLIYTTGSPAYSNYRSFIRRSLNSWPARAHLTAHVFDCSDHVFTLLDNQSQLVRLVHDWALSLHSLPTGSSK